MNKQLNILPKLRFEEFKELNEWRLFRGNELFESISNKNHNSDLPILAITQEYGAIPRDMIDFNVIVSDKSVSTYKVVEIGDFIISLRSFQGGIEYSNYKGLCSPAYIILRNKKELSRDFFKYYFKSQRYIAQLNKSLEGIRDGKMVSYGQFSEIYLPFPELKEQEKIAKTLTSIDELISASEQKLKLLEQQKKGLLQNLFPQHGKTIPNLRFPAFINQAEWQIKPLGNYIEEYRAISEKNDEYTVLTSSKNGLVKQSDYFGNHDRIVSKENIGFNIIPKGYMTYRSRSDNSTFYFNENNLGFTGIISTYYPVFKIKNGINNFFIMLFSAFSNEIGKHSVGTSQTVLSMNTLKKLKLPIPSFEEQKEISNIFNIINNLIYSQEIKIEFLRNHKKGLMQQLFPNIDSEFRHNE